MRFLTADYGWKKLLFHIQITGLATWQVNFTVHGAQGEYVKMIFSVRIHSDKSFQAFFSPFMLRAQR